MKQPSTERQKLRTQEVSGLFIYITKSQQEDTFISVSVIFTQSCVTPTSAAWIFKNIYFNININIYIQEQSKKGRKAATVLIKTRLYNLDVTNIL